MPISGLVVTAPESAHDSVLSELGGHDSLTVGPATGPRIPVVVDSQTVNDDRDTYFWIQSLPSVTQVEVAYLDFSDIQTLKSHEKRRMGNRRGANQ